MTVTKYEVESPLFTGSAEEGHQELQLA